MRGRALLAVLAAIASLHAMAALVDESTSEGSRLDAAVQDGAVVYADETSGVFPVHISLEGLGVAEALLFVGDVGPVAVTDGMDVAVGCLSAKFKVIPLRLVAGDLEMKVGVAVYRTRGESCLVHALDSFPSRLDTCGLARLKLTNEDGIRYSALWGGGEWVRVVAYAASEYGKPGAQGVVIVDRNAPEEGTTTLARRGITLPSGNYVLEHSDGVHVLTVSAKIGKLGFIVILN